MEDAENGNECVVFELQEEGMKPALWRCLEESRFPVVLWMSWETLCTPKSHPLQWRIPGKISEASARAHLERAPALPPLSAWEVGRNHSFHLPMPSQIN